MGSSTVQRWFLLLESQIGFFVPVAVCSFGTKYILAPTGFFPSCKLCPWLSNIWYLKEKTIPCTNYPINLPYPLSFMHFCTDWLTWRKFLNCHFYLLYRPPSTQTIYQGVITYYKSISTFLPKSISWAWDDAKVLNLFILFSDNLTC